MPALLQEGALIADAVGVQHRIHVHIHEILEILLIGGGDGIYRLVRIGHGIQEGIERALHQLHKGILQREPLRAAEHGMLRDMCHTGGIRRRCPEGNAENPVRVRILHGQHPSAGFPMPVQNRIGSQLLDSSAVLHFIFFHVFYSFNCAVPPASLSGTAVISALFSSFPSIDP